MPISYTHQELSDLYRQARDENERLRAALLEIVKLKDPPFNWRGEYSHAINIAQSALNGPTTDGR